MTADEPAPPAPPGGKNEVGMEMIQLQRDVSGMIPELSPFFGSGALPFPVMAGLWHCSHITIYIYIHSPETITAQQFGSHLKLQKS